MTCVLFIVPTYNMCHVCCTHTYHVSCVLYPHITSHVPGEYRCGGVTGDAVSYFQVTSVITYIE